MAVTTAGAIRDVIIARIESKTPPTNGQYPYVPHRHDRMSLRRWASANPSACYRHFSVEYRGDTEPVEVTDAVIEQVRGTFEIVIAYPNNNRFGNRLGLHDEMDSDLRHIDRYAGTTGFSETPTSNATIISQAHAREDGDDEPVWFAVLTLSAAYKRAV